MLNQPQAPRLPRHPGDAHLSAALEGSNVAMHPMVLGELAYAEPRV
jgi:hypothetical protein